MHQVVVDWDGTAVPSVWPTRPTTFMPGFVENMHRFHAAGVSLVIQSARTTPYNPVTQMRVPDAAVAEEVQYIRDTLDRAGLTFISIWTQEGKAPGSVYVDDRAERYMGTQKAWDKVTDRVLLRLGKEPAKFPAFRGGS